MITDARRLSDGTTVEADICIIGAGAAGLTIARHFAGARHRVCLLESGGRNFEYARQKLSRGSVIGQDYEPLDLCRVRQFGGSTGKAGWGGWCKPLARGDFAARHWVPKSGWPIGLDDLMPFYIRAASTLGLPLGHDWQVRPLGDTAHPPLLSEPCALTPLLHMGDHAYDTLAKARNVTVLLYATATHIHCDPGSSEIRDVQVRTVGKNTIRIKARHFVLALGGIENARLLLLSDDHCPAGLGNGYDLVGRHFMEHPRLRWGHMMMAQVNTLVAGHDPREAERAGAQGLNTINYQHPIAGITLNPAVLESEGLLGSRTWIKPTGPMGHNPAAQALQELTFWPRKGRKPANTRRNAMTVVQHGAEVARALLARIAPQTPGPVHFSFDTIVEQEPDPANRVTLDDAVDAFGQRRAKLEWRLSPLLQRTLWTTQQILTQQAGQLGYQCVIGAPENAGIEGLPIRWVRHHMGTTRMGADQTNGVVDRNCQIFGVPNGFVAGSSVFPTGGNDMPTMTIVALAHRLAEHIEKRL